MIKAKKDNKIVASFKTLQEAGQAMVEANAAATTKGAMQNIASAINGTEGRKFATKDHPVLGQPRLTAYGYKWVSTKR